MGCAQPALLVAARHCFRASQFWCYGTLLGAKAKILSRIVALSFSLMLAFSISMWSQAVIAEVYALHALLIAIFLVLCYRWVQHPASDRLMLSIFFVLGLSFSNHHLTMTLAPLPYLLILLLRRRAFFDWFFAGVLTVLLGYLGFRYLVRGSRRPSHGNSLLLLCRPSLRHLCLAAAWPASLEIDCASFPSWLPQAFFPTLICRSLRRRILR